MTVAVVVATEPVAHAPAALVTATGDDTTVVAAAAVAPTPEKAPPAAPVVLATAELPYGGDTGQSLLDRLLRQLASLNVSNRHLITRPGTAQELRKNGHEAGVVESDDLTTDLRELARLAASTTEPLLILHGDLVISDEQLARLVHDNASGAAALVAGPRHLGGPATRPPVRVAGGHVASAGSRHHRVTGPNAEFRGVLRTTGAATAQLAEVATELADLVAALPELSELPGPPGLPGPGEQGDGGTGREPAEEPAGQFVDAGAVAVARALRDAGVDDGLGGTAPRGDDAPALLLVALVRAGLPVAARPLRHLVCDRALTAQEAASARAVVESIDEDRVRLDAAVKSNDGFFTTYAVSTYSRFIARWAARWGLTPNQVTSVSMGVAVLSAVWFSAGTRTGMLLGAVLLYVAFVFDCVDGQLARYTRRFSPLGAWLDATFDRAKEYVVYVGLAIGATAAAVGSSVHAGEVWGLAVTALVLQTVRHMVDFAFEAGRARQPVPTSPVLSLAVPGDQPPPDTPSDAPARQGGPARSGRGLGNVVVQLSRRTERLPALRWAKKIVILPIGERFALIAVTAALSNARVTFLALLTWGAFALAYTLTGRVLRAFAR